MTKHQDKAPTNSEKSKKQMGTPNGPQSAENGSESPIPSSRIHSNSGGTQMQDVNQNGLNDAGNPTKNNTPGGGNSEEQRVSQANKPRHNPNATQFDAK
ncbi:hypothetical protein [Hymenobacter chitinivorans]|uniref:Uncharacterized protein n=1 Tax=Hymenobacter chitinivorans DSM 11115 TaxID=1121954 RepID=A0A2M9AT34_9BACT|nr:hypothetical protein [Hymenobacter chitinivorans]PJJ48827.1 hypothetical protein CLV45_4540 [Hymenobacter chitinivorans DSM 11115]